MDIRVLVTIGLIVGAILLIIYFIIMYTGNCYPICDAFDVIKGVILPIVAIGLLAISYFTGVFLLDTDRQDFYDNVKSYVTEQGYTIWIDGIEVELEHITIENYLRSSISVKEEIKEIHIKR